MKKTILIPVIILLMHCSLLFAQGQPTPEPGEPIKSMGQPSKWEFYVAPMALYDGDLDKWGGHLTGGLWRYLMNPNYGIGLVEEWDESAIRYMEQFYDRPAASSNFGTAKRSFLYPERMLDYLFFRIPKGWSGAYQRVDQLYGSDHYPLLGRVQMGDRE